MRLRIVGVLVGVAVLTAACGSPGAPPEGRPTIVVTYSVLGAVVEDLVGDAATIQVLMPNGADPHEWQPSAKDIETLTRADLLVENGLGLEGGMASAFAQAEAAGVKRFIAADHVTVRHVGAGEGADPSDPDQAPGAPDPHLWMDPLTIRDAMDALALQLESDLGIDVGTRAADLDARLATLNDEVAAILAAVPEADRTLVTGHESLGYFAARYGFRLIGAIVPSLSSAAEPSAADLAALVGAIRAARVPALFTELGTPPQVSRAVGAETGAKVVEVMTAALPPDGSYDSFMKNLATLVADNLR
ncbi:MAG: metal ABC transporter substrate-binding protein [Chloroflexi bacterium]|nr:metal ABC transporter substrate-binding protein [Chloroflexota bacterium]